MHRLAEQAHPAFPVTIYYAFKQSERRRRRHASTGWETFLEAVIRAGFAITGTWPMRTELASRMLGIDTNALASSIVLVVARAPQTRPRPPAASSSRPSRPSCPRRSHICSTATSLRSTSRRRPSARNGSYTRYAKVLDAEGEPLSVHEALALINQTLDEALAEQEGDFDADSRWAMAWFEQTGSPKGSSG